jgi:excisionase family DNA binding protein
MSAECEARIIALLEQLVAASQPRPALMTKREVARELRISVRSVERLTQVGELPRAISIGGQLRWAAKDLDQFLQEAPR